MKKYPGRLPPTDALKETADTLELQVAPDFVSRPPRVHPQIMFQRIGETMPWRNRPPGEAERPLAQKVGVESVL